MSPTACAGYPQAQLARVGHRTHAADLDVAPITSSRIAISQRSSSRLATVALHARVEQDRGSVPASSTGCRCEIATTGFEVDIERGHHNLGRRHDIGELRVDLGVDVFEVDIQTACQDIFSR